MTVCRQDFSPDTHDHTRTTVIVKSTAGKTSWVCHSDSPDLGRHKHSHTCPASANTRLLSHKERRSPCQLPGCLAPCWAWLCECILVLNYRTQKNCWPETLAIRLQVNWTLEDANCCPVCSCVRMGVQASPLYCSFVSPQLQGEGGLLGLSLFSP